MPSFARYEEAQTIIFDWLGFMSFPISLPASRDISATFSFMRWFGGWCLQWSESLRELKSILRIAINYQWQKVQKSFFESCEPCEPAKGETYRDLAISKSFLISKMRSFNSYNLSSAITINFRRETKFLLRVRPVRENFWHRDWLIVTSGLMALERNQHS